MLIQKNKNLDVHEIVRTYIKTEDTFAKKRG